LKPTKSNDAHYLLISDSAVRPDAVAISKEEWEKAEKAKTNMEEL